MVTTQYTPYTPGVGRLVTGQTDFGTHVDGYGFQHKAKDIMLEPSIIIDGYTCDNVQIATEKLSVVITPPIIQDATEIIKGILKLSGDLAGSADSPQVTKIQGYPILRTEPQNGDVLTWDATNAYWAPSSSSFSTPYASDQVYGLVKIAGPANYGDIGGNAGNLTIEKIQTYPVNISDPVSSDFFKWDGSAWINSQLPIADSNTYGVFKLSGDVSGYGDNLKIVGIQNYPVAANCPNPGDILMWNGSPTNSWVPQQYPLATSETAGVTYLNGDVSPNGVGGITVVGINGSPIANQIPYNGQYLKYSYNPEDGGSWTFSDIQAATSSQAGISALTNDLGGTYLQPTVVGIYNNLFDTSVASPAEGQILSYKSGKWASVFPESSFAVSGDLIGNNISQTVTGWYGKPLSTSFLSPTPGSTVIYNSAGQWALTPFTGGPTGPIGPTGPSGGGTGVGSTGPTGADGIDGVGYDGLTSVTGISIVSTLLPPYSKTFTTNLSVSQTAFTVGSRVRATITSPTLYYLEGNVTAFYGNSLTVQVDATNITSTGTYGGSTNVWHFSIAGVAGSAGPAGPAGSAGTAGPTGPTGNAAVGSVLVFGANGPLSAVNNTNLIPGGPTTNNAINAYWRIIAPVSGTVSRLYVSQNGALLPGSVTYTVCKNGSATLLAVTISSTSTPPFTDTVHSFSVTAGDAISIKLSFGVAAHYSITDVVVSMLLS